MVRNFIDGYDVVYGVRNKRDTDTFFKRTTAIGFYKLMQFMGVNIVFNHADYRLMSKRALDGLAQFPERNLFLRGMVPLVGLSLNECVLRQKRTLCGRVKISVKEKCFHLRLMRYNFIQHKPNQNDFGIRCDCVRVCVRYGDIRTCAENYRSHRCRLGVTLWFRYGL